MRVKQLHSALFIIFSILLFGVSSCKKDEDPLVLAETNRWILDSMQTYYYWNEQLPDRPVDQDDPNSFFTSLLNSTDRFSFLENATEIKTEYSSFAWYGLEYAILEQPSVGIITLVVPDGPADRAGLQRGDFFTAINGVPVNPGNISEISTLLKQGDGIVLKTAVMSNGTFIDNGELNIDHYVFSEQPIYLSKVVYVGGKKVGYIFYNQFNGNYDQQILQIIGTFQNKGVREIVFDLRYNPGGDVSSVAKIAAALSKVSANDPFVIYQANRRGGRRTNTFQKTMNENNFAPQSFSEVLSHRLDVDRVFILTTEKTTSAAELLINTLKPYSNVVTIGTRSQGKDMASFAIEDMRSPKTINFVLHPLVFKLYNASGQGDYSDGLKPDHVVNEFTTLPLSPFGDENDPLLQKAFELINEGTRPTAKLQGQSQSLQLHNNTAHYGERAHLLLTAKKDHWETENQ